MFSRAGWVGYDWELCNCLLRFPVTEGEKSISQQQIWDPNKHIEVSASCSICSRYLTTQNFRCIWFLVKCRQQLKNLNVTYPFFCMFFFFHFSTLAYTDKKKKRVKCYNIQSTLVHAAEVPCIGRIEYNLTLLWLLCQLGTSPTKTQMDG